MIIVEYFLFVSAKVLMFLMLCHSISVHLVSFIFTKNVTHLIL